jgi:hypothetical protein
MRKASRPRRAAAYRPQFESLETLCLMTATAIQGTGQLIRAVENKALSARVATFTVNDSTANSKDFLVAIDWGDGTQGAGAVSKSGSRYSVTGKHAYKDQLDTHQVSVSIAVKANGVHASVLSSSRIAGATFHVNSSTISAVANVPDQNQILGKFQLLNKKTSVTSLVASVNYYDDTSNPHALIVADPSVRNGFEVVDNHTFASRPGGGVSVVTVRSAVKPGLGFTLSDPTTVAPPPDSWTIMVYMEADNNLSAFAQQNIVQMEQAAASLPGTVHLAVYLHQENDPAHEVVPIPTGNGSQIWTGSGEAILSPNANGVRIVTQFDTSLHEQNTGDPNTLVNFINWAAATEPAQHYALVMWDHGAAWAGTEFHNAAPGGHLSVTDLGSALHAVSVEPQPVHIDVLAFDASLMQTTEVGFKLSPYVTEIVGSEESPPGAGYPYQAMFAGLSSHPGQVDAAALAASMTQQYQNVMGDNTDTSQSALNGAQFGPLLNALRTFTSVADATPSISQILLNARNQAIGFRYDFQRDLGQFMALVASSAAPAQVRDAALGVMTALGNLVAAKGADSVNSTGLAIYFPATLAQLQNPPFPYLPEYQDFDLATGWYTFLTHTLQGM